MQESLFPKKVSIAAVIVTIMFLVINGGLYYRLSQQFENVYSNHFPILEMNAINIRLSESLSNMTRILVLEYDENFNLAIP